MQEESKDARCIPYPPDLNSKLTVHFKFNIGDPVIVKGMNISGLVITAAVNHTGGKMYEISNGDKTRWVAESFLTINRDLYDPWCGTEPQPLRREGGE